MSAAVGHDYVSSVHVQRRTVFRRRVEYRAAGRSRTTTMWFLKALLAGLLSVASVQAATSLVQFNVHSARSGNWSDPKTWLDKRVPQAGGNVQVRSRPRVGYE